MCAVTIQMPHFSRLPTQTQNAGIKHLQAVVQSDEGRAMRCVPSGSVPGVIMPAVITLRTVVRPIVDPRSMQKSRTPLSSSLSLVKPARLTRPVKVQAEKETCMGSQPVI